MFLGARALVNLTVAVFDYIRLLCPFTTSPLAFNKLMVALTTASLLVSSVPVARAIMLHKIELYEYCEVSDVKAKASMKIMITGYLMCIYIFVYLFFLPAYATVHLYRTTIATLAKSQGIDDATQKDNTGENVFRLVILELEKTLMCDGIAMAFFYSPLFIVEFINEFCLPTLGLMEYEINLTTQVCRLIAAFYGTVYIIVSLWTRGVYSGAQQRIVTLIHIKSEEKKQS